MQSKHLTMLKHKWKILHHHFYKILKMVLWNDVRVL